MGLCFLDGKIGRFLVFWRRVLAAEVVVRIREVRIRGVPLVAK